MTSYTEGVLADLVSAARRDLRIEPWPALGGGIGGVDLIINGGETVVTVSYPRPLPDPDTLPDEGDCIPMYREKEAVL